MLSLALAILALHSLAYGTASVADPSGMAKEFGDDQPPNESAENLTGLVGVLLMLMGVAAALASYWTARYACPEGIWLAGALAVVTFAVGLYWTSRGRFWDAGFYLSAGSLLGGMTLWLARQQRLRGPDERHES